MYVNISVTKNPHIIWKDVLDTCFFQYILEAGNYLPIPKL